MFLDRLKAASGSSERVAMKSASVHLHGEIVLLLHWCELNYIGLVKILKKHDKKTGLLLRSPFLANVVKQPFCSTTILKRLVKQVEETILEEEDGGAAEDALARDQPAEEDGGWRRSARLAVTQCDARVVRECRPSTRAAGAGCSAVPL